jgi:hypothetical protein
MMVCTGPASEEESSSHEKMYMIVREGPIHRCMFCGQCFKLIKLKDDVYDYQNTYYSTVFTEISPKIVQEQELQPHWVTFPFVSHEINNNCANVMPEDRNYLFVNGDEADHIMVDPAYRMERYKDLEQEYFKFNLVYQEISRQRDLIRNKGLDTYMMPRDTYETWIQVEKAILKFDREFNRFEKFAGRALFDAENHGRRERRMLERKSKREEENYTFYFNGLNEEEQMYRDYYESDIEDDMYPESSVAAEISDTKKLRDSGDFDTKYIQFLETTTVYEKREQIDDIVGKMLFNYKYRNVSDKNFEERNERVLRGFQQRAQSRDANLVEDLGDKLENIFVEENVANEFLREINIGNSDVLEKYGLLNFAKYVAEEGLIQFKEYYGEDLPNKDILNDLPEREKLRFAEVYFNFYNRSLEVDKTYAMIPKRPYDSKKSIMANFVEDLFDFNSRVRPIARNLAFKNSAAEHGLLPLNENEQKKTESNQRYRKVLGFTKTGDKEMI